MRTVVNEYEIVAKLQGKDPKGLELLYEAYGGPLLGLISRMTSDPQMAEQVLHDSFWMEWNHPSTLSEGGQSLFIQLYKTAKKLALNLKKTGTFTPKTNACVIKTLHQSEMGDQHILDNLNKSYRDTLWALYFNGYSLTEWSEASDEPKDKVIQKLVAAIQEIRSHQVAMLIFIFLNISL